MRIFSYRNKTRLKKGLIFTAVAALLVFAILIGVFIYLQRFLVYTADGVRLDFSQPSTISPVQSADKSENSPLQNDGVTPEIDIVMESETVTNQKERFSGLYLTTSMLADLDSVTSALSAMETPQAVMVDMKSIFGNFYYQSSIDGTQTASADLTGIAELLSDLKEKGVYLIARIPSFSDSNFALANQSCGLALSSGALWMDENGCYWLNPDDALVVYYLEAIAAELESLGFQEVVFDQFAFPDSENIVYPEEFSQEDALVNCATQLVSNLQDSGIAVSFGSTVPSVASLGYRTYLSASEGSQVASLVQTFSTTLEDPSSQIVFVTTSRDTRFQTYSVLLPLVDSQT